MNAKPHVAFETAQNALQDSWSRSQHYGLTREDDAFPQMPAAHLADVLANNAQLQTLSRPVMHELARQIATQQAVVVLSDNAGVVLNTCGNSDSLEKVERFALVPGNLWSECGRGTNAIGTALALDDSCEIRGEEHFLVKNRGLYCAATALQAPTGALAGALDISGPARFPHQQTFMWVQQAARRIEHLWAKASLQSDQWLMCLHPEATGLDTPDEGVLLFSDNLLMAANRIALHYLRITPAQLGLLTFTHLFPQAQQRSSRCPYPITTAHDDQFWCQLTAPTQRHVSVPQAAPVTLWPLQQEAAKALRLLNAGVSLCITGETGCGKEHVSRSLWQQSQWRSGRFVAINCASLPEALIESELFGYQPGAFTGANKQGYLGKIREADGGVLFLDEIGDMPLPLQSRLLRVLQEKEVTPLGENRSYKVNFTVICATHRDLALRVAEGQFREDLLWRLQEYRFTLPALRDWQNIPAFIQHLWQEMGGKQRRITLSDTLITTLSAYPWPGNVRQLRSVLKVLLALADDGDTLVPTDLPPEVRSCPVPAALNLQSHDDALIEQTLKYHQGNISRAAAALGVARSTLYRRAARARDSERQED